MPFNGSNSFSIVNTFVPGTTILSSAVNANFSDIATGLSDCVTRDAQGAVTGNLLFSSTGYIGLPTGTTGQRPGSPLQGYFRFNSSTSTPEYYDGTAWDSVSTIVVPQGYITITSGTPIISNGDVTGATAVYYTPYLGQLCPIWNGTSFGNQVFTEQTLTLNSNHLASTIYDVFAFLNSGVFTIGTGPAWNSSGAGSSSRGSGAGTTALSRIKGVWTNGFSITARNGSTTYTVGVNQATYLGSILIDGSAGQISCYRTYGQNRKFGIWNFYNRVPIMLKAGPSTSSWTVGGGGSWQALHGDANNAITWFTGIAEEEAHITLRVNGQVSGVTNGTGELTVGIGFNSTTGPSSQAFLGCGTSSATNTVTTIGTPHCDYIATPNIGVNTITALEQVVSQVGTLTLFGTEVGSSIVIIYRG